MRSIAEALGWWAALFLVWWATLATSAPEELVAAAVGAAGTALVAVAARRVVGRSWPAPRGWTAALRHLPLAVQVDTVRLFGRIPRLLADRRTNRHADGGLRHLPAPAGRDNPTYRAAVTLLLSATPATFVLDWPPGSDGPAGHAALPRRTAMERELPRCSG